MKDKEGDGERERETQNRVDVETELDTIRKSILRQWYAVKIILVSATTRRLQGAGGDQKGEREVRGEKGREEGGGDGTGFSDTKTVRFGISQNLWYACIWREQTLTVFSVFHNCPPPGPLSLLPVPIALSHSNATASSVRQRVYFRVN